MTKKLNVYIAGPMSGHPQLNFPAFNRAEVVLREMGYNPINPTRHPQGLREAHYYELGAVDAKLSDKIALLPGWENSKGVRIELIAHAIAFTIMQGKKVITNEEIEKVETRRIYNFLGLGGRTLRLYPRFSDQHCPICQNTGIVLSEKPIKCLCIKQVYPVELVRVRSATHYDG